MPHIKKIFSNTLLALQLKPKSLANGYMMLWFSSLTKEINERLVLSGSPVSSVPIFLPRVVDAARFVGLFSLLGKWTGGSTSDLGKMNHVICQQFQLLKDGLEPPWHLSLAVRESTFSSSVNVVCGGKYFKIDEYDGRKFEVIKVYFNPKDGVVSIKGHTKSSVSCPGLVELSHLSVCTHLNFKVVRYRAKKRELILNNLLELVNCLPAGGDIRLTKSLIKVCVPSDGFGQFKLDVKSNGLSAVEFVTDEI